MGERISKRKEYQGFIKNADNEIETVDLTSVTYRPELDEQLFISQAPPMRITPSRARPAPKERGIRARIISVPDAQIGFRDTQRRLDTLHDERAMEAARLAIKSLQPDVIVLQGDTIDLPELTRFDPDSTDFTPRTLQLGIDRTAKWKGELRADNPRADMHEIEGNHEARLGKFVLKHAMMLHGIRQAGGNLPVVSYEFLTRNADTRTTYHDGYPASEWAYSDDLLFIHGKEVASNGSTAKKYSDKYPDTNVVFGHVHRHEAHSRTTRLGKELVAITFGTLARVDGAVPSYGSGRGRRGVNRRNENWQQGIGVIDDYGKGNYTFRHIPIRKGRALM